jgi:hypothetical protein
MVNDTIVGIPEVIPPIMIVHAVRYHLGWGGVK